MNEVFTDTIDHQHDNHANEPIDPKKLLAFGSKQIISLFVPVSICMLMVGIVAKTINYYSTTDYYLIYTPFHTKDADVATTVWQSLANALILIVMVVIMSILLVLLYKYKCYKFIHGYLILSTVVILFVLFTLFFVEVVISMNIFMDYITLALLIWNFGVVGFVVIHWKGPLILQQSYLIIISAKVALILLKFMPLWTTWVVLGVLAIWDLVAVLCPFGPLRILVEIATERNEPIFPALIYSTTATMMVKTGDPAGANDVESSAVEDNNSHINNLEGNLLPDPSEPIDSEQQTVLVNTRKKKKIAVAKARKSPNIEPAILEVPANQTSSRGNIQGADFQQVQIKDDHSRIRRNIRDIHEDMKDRGDRGVKLGLGDFVFYSLLMGRATLDSDPNTIMACYVAILVGMFLTILLLTIAGRALPALPISMACGILFYFLTSLIISPFAKALWLQRVFI